MRLVGFVVSHGFQIIGVAALSVFEQANAAATAPVYDVRVLSETGGPVVSLMGISLSSEIFGEHSYDSVIFGGGQTEASPKTLGFVMQSMNTARRVAAVCRGAFVLGQAGILDGHRIAAHWADAPSLQRRFPAVRVHPDRRLIIDGPIWTAAGAAAGIDLALGMVGSDLGAETAHQVAKALLVSDRRVGGHLQHSILLPLQAQSDRMQMALDFAKANLGSRLGVPELAAIAGLSPRQFTRAFQSEVGQPPAKAVEMLRVDAARVLMEQTRQSMDTIADQTGFADPNRMRRAFIRAFGQPPQALRRLDRNERRNAVDHLPSSQAFAVPSPAGPPIVK